VSTSQRTFEQVKSILGKLDREREAARKRRTEPPAAPRPLEAAQKPAPLAPQPVPPASAVAPPLGPAPGGQSGFGRAKPMRPMTPHTPAHHRNGHPNEGLQNKAS
jgi:hypothetical protein